MNFRVSVCVFGLLFLLQLSDAGGDQNEEDRLVLLNKKVENFIKQILNTVRSYNKEMRGNSNCIPDDFIDNAMEALKRSIDCVDSNEKKYGMGRINAKAHRKQFLLCFARAREEVKKCLNATQNACLEKQQEKVYEVNVTTAITKTFFIKFRNGMNVTSRKVQFIQESGEDGGSSEFADEERKGNETQPGGQEMWKKSMETTASDDIFLEPRSEENVDSLMEEDQGYGNSTLRVDQEDDSEDDDEDYDSL